MLEKNENIINADEVVETAPVYNETVKKKRNIVVSIILIMVAILLCVGAYFGISTYRHNSIIEKVKSSTLGGYSKTVEEAFNECFGEENLEWKYDDKAVTVRMPKFDNIDVNEIIKNNNNFTVIDLGNNVKSSYRYMYLTGWTIDFEYNYDTKEVTDVILKSGFIKFNKNDDCEPVTLWHLLKAEPDSLDKLLLHGVFKENLDIYNETIKRSNGNDKQEIAQELLNRLKDDNIDNQIINEAQAFLTDNHLITEKEADNMSLEKLIQLIQVYLDTQSDIQKKSDGINDKVARLAAASPYETE